MTMPVSSLLLLLTLTPSHSHPGGTNAQGCHLNKKTGETHCHTKKKRSPQSAQPRTRTLSTTTFNIQGGNHTFMSFSSAKQSIKNIYQDNQRTFYCNCKYKKKTIDLESCGYKIKKDRVRALRMEWEHVVPAHAFGQAFVEWREGDSRCIKKGKKYKGRDCAQKANPLFARMEADLYNLVPAIGEVNGNRSNYSMAEISGEERQYGQCDVEIKDRKIEPRDEIKGDVARIYFYMDQTYPGLGIISKKNRSLFEAWNKMDPVSREECSRAHHISRLQGNKNKVLTRACTKLENSPAPDPAPTCNTCTSQAPLDSHNKKNIERFR